MPPGFSTGRSPLSPGKKNKGKQIENTRRTKEKQFESQGALLRHRCDVFTLAWPWLPGCCSESISFRRSVLLAFSPSLHQVVINFAAPLTTPIYHDTPFFSFVAVIHWSMGSSDMSGLSFVDPSLASKATISPSNVFDKFCAGRPGSNTSLPSSFASISRFGRRPSSGLASAT